MQGEVPLANVREGGVHACSQPPAAHCPAGLCIPHPTPHAPQDGDLSAQLLDGLLEARLRLEARAEGILIGVDVAAQSAELALHDGVLALRGAGRGAKVMHSGATHGLLPPSSRARTTLTLYLRHASRSSSSLRA